MREMKNFDDPEITVELIRTSRLLSVPFTTVEGLAACVAVYRMLGIDKVLAKACMQELARRRQEGLEFDYEAYIDNAVDQMPKRQEINLIQVSKDIHKGVINNLKIGKLKKGIKINE